MNKAEIFNYITDEYSNMILHWAIKKVSSRDEAADLAQEIMLQVFSSVSREVDRGKTIDKLENFVWKIAHNVWCYYLRGKNRASVCISMAPDFDVQSDDDFAARLGDEEEMKALISKMRRTVVFLNKMQRETMIMHYIEGFSIAEIAKKLKCTESSVKWYLFDTRKKLKKELDTMENTNFVYRPGKLHLAKCGNSPANSDADVVNKSATMQNIILICYTDAKTIDEIANTLGIPKAYIESDIEWLVQREFLTESNNRYIAAIPIENNIYSQSVTMIYKKYKECLIDPIIDGILSAENEIREIDFTGNHQPINKLLWVLIYMFLDRDGLTFFDFQTVPIRPDGGKYVPKGFDRSDNQKSLEGYDTNIDLRDFNFNGGMNFYPFRWCGIYNFSFGTPEKMCEPDSEKSANLRDTVIKALHDDFSPDQLNGKEKDAFAEILKDGWMTLHDGKCTPNFYVFTREQHGKLMEVLNPIKEMISGKLESIKNEFGELCKKSFPSHVYETYKDFSIAMAMYFIIYYTEFFAMNDGKSYKPTDCKDGELLTLWCIVDDHLTM